MAAKAKPKVVVKAPPVGNVRGKEPAHEFEIGRLNLQGPKGTVLQLEVAASAITLESTIEGASTLTIKVRDYDRQLLRSEPLNTLPSNLVMDAVSYTLAKVSRSGDELTLIFEDTSINILRRYDSPVKATRDSMTRAQFIRKLVIEPKERTLFLDVPELNNRQPIARTGAA